ncbi:MAG: hypothetical protein FWC91_03190 [Defluviitaleaceae bacterium]|nr:hypothetical protein [Defluviitaleaceae bacterium]
MKTRETVRSFLYLCLTLIVLFCIAIISIDFMFPLVRIIIVVILVLGGVTLIIVYNIFKEKL